MPTAVFFGLWTSVTNAQTNTCGLPHLVAKSHCYEHLLTQCSNTRLTPIVRKTFRRGVIDRYRRGVIDRFRQGVTLGVFFWFRKGSICPDAWKQWFRQPAPLGHGSPKPSGRTRSFCQKCRWLVTAFSSSSCRGKGSGSASQVLQQYMVKKWSRSMPWVLLKPQKTGDLTVKLCTFSWCSWTGGDWL